MTADENKAGLTAAAAAAGSDGNSSVTSAGSKKKKKKEGQPQASISDTLGFVFNCGGKTKLLFAIGMLAGIGNGLVFPGLAWLFSTSFSDLSSAAINGIEPIEEIAFYFMGFGAYALVMASIQAASFEIVARDASMSLRLKWFHALLRQDSAFFDVYDIAGLASNINPSANRYRRGLGRKFGEGIQFGVTALGGLVYAFYASWKIALVILAIIPLLAITASLVVFYNQSKTTRAAKAYGRAGSVAYSTVSAIRTVLSLNAVPTMIDQYTTATKEAYNDSIGMLFKQGFANGSMLGSFILLYCALALYGTYLIYSDVEETGCDPTGGIPGNETCSSSGPDVFGAMLGIAFAGQGISQVGNALGTFTAARVATFEALKAINRTQGAEGETIYEEAKEMDSETTHSRKSSKSKKSDIENGEKKVKAILPTYQIDSSSTAGKKPTDIAGRITFENIHFAYPTRPGDPILKGLSLDIQAGKTVAFVGPSGGGKSTVVKMLERFYDPLEGSIKLDGVDIKDINVRHFRSLIGYVGQEPTLFATSIAQNIRYGNPNATQEQIEEAARMANAHDFITSFSDGYDTQVGDKGTQLSGGQKQRIAIARILVADPTILLLDEATSALDSESELVVQEALDNVLAARKRTTCIIAHRLSTIRNADVIAVVMNGTIVEKGTHDELMEAETGYYRKLVEKQDTSGLDGMSRSSSATDLTDSRESSQSDLAGLAEKTEGTEVSVPLGGTVLEFDNVTFAYPTRLKKRILKDFSLKICKGETVALVGPSGGGKSTTVSLIERFYDPLEGTMKYLDNDVKTLNPRWYRDQIGYVGQEPTLFNDTIANNIKYGAPNATREEIVEACKQSNAHDFIMTFPDGYDTMVGERGTQISGGQKQRIAIARALVKKPKVLLLDEATSALDNESEAIVQEALDKLMGSNEHTCVVIAHRLSTIRNATRIAFIADGHVKEFGSHEELMEKPKGRYRRLVESQKRKTTAASLGLKTTSKIVEEEKDEEEEEDKGLEEAEKKAFDGARARRMASVDVGHLLIGAFGALLAGGVFPMWGLLFAETIDLLFRPVNFCEEGNVPDGSPTCDDYLSPIVDSMREDSYLIALYWAIVVVACIVGNVLTFYGFGVASERVNKRVRDQAFTALARQEVSYFDKHSVGSITSRLQDDAARIHTFIGDPVRSLLIALSSVVTGLVLSFVFMWPFALVGIACVPLMGFATSLEMKQVFGEDEGDNADKDELNSPGGIIVETLLNIGTVSALTMEEARFNDFRHALDHSEPAHVQDAIKTGILYGLSQFIQQWINALQFWWGGYIIIEFDHLGFDFNDFLVSNFALLFSLFGLGAAFQDIADRKETEASAGRIFYLLDRQSAIDPLSEEGKKLA